MPATNFTLYPYTADVIMPLLDGWTPIVPADMNVYQDVMERVEDVLGAGPTNVVKSQFGPKSGNASLAERLDAMLDTDGTLKDIALVTGTRTLGEFSESNVGAFIGFGKSLSRAGDSGDAYHIMFDCKSQGSEEEGGTEVWDPLVPACWWVTSRTLTGCFIAARDMLGNAIDAADQKTVQFNLLAIGYDAFSTGAL